MARLKDRVAIVTGGGVGIGEVVRNSSPPKARRLVVADIDDAGAERVAAEIQASGGEAFAVHVDISDEASCRSALRQVLERYGRVTCTA